MYPWITTQPLGTGTQIRLERNPYYWKVDEKGNQLPYVDKLLGISYQDAESRTFAMLNGDLDFIKDPGNENRVVYHDAMNAGKPIQIKYPVSDGANVCSIHFNQTLSDTVKAEVFGSKDFRVGMSYAINRKEVIEIVFAGQGTPAQVAPNTDSLYYIKAWTRNTSSTMWRKPTNTSTRSCPIRTPAGCAWTRMASPSRSFSWCKTTFPSARNTFRSPSC